MNCRTFIMIMMIMMMKKNQQLRENKKSKQDTDIYRRINSENKMVSDLQSLNCVIILKLVIM